MAGDAQTKRPSEIIQLGADFTQSLLTGEIIVGGNVSVTVVNALTDASASGTILVSGSVGLVGNVVRGRFQAGADGDTYVVTFDTGATNLGNRYQATMNLLVTNYPAGDNLLCNLSEAKLVLGITDTSDDALIDALILSATKYILARIGRDLFFKTRTERIYLEAGSSDDTDGDGVARDRIDLRHYPVRQIDSIKIVSADGTVQQTISDTTSYDYTSYGSVFFRHTYAFAVTPDYNEITYRAGYDDIPGDLREACKRLVAVLYRMQGREGLTSERLGDYMWQAQSGSIPKEAAKELSDGFVEGVIARYRRTDVAL